jgi:hypothetical protein
LIEMYVSATRHEVPTALEKRLQCYAQLDDVGVKHSFAVDGVTRNRPGHSAPRARLCGSLPEALDAPEPPAAVNATSATEIRRFAWAETWKDPRSRSPANRSSDIPILGSTDLATPGQGLLGPGGNAHAVWRTDAPRCQAERDHAALTAVVKAGKIAVEFEVWLWVANSQGEVIRARLGVRAQRPSLGLQSGVVELNHVQSVAPGTLAHGVNSSQRRNAKLARNVKPAAPIFATR